VTAAPTIYPIPTDLDPPAIGMSDVLAAASRLKGVALRTPVITSPALDELVGGQVFLKCENFQRIGAFKFRGAYNAISMMDPEDRARGVVTASSGNHAQAVALAAKLHGIPAWIIMPEDAPQMKLDSTRSLGAEVIIYDRYTQDRLQLSLDTAAEKNATYVSPYDNEGVMAGQGTAAMELIEEAGELDLLLVCLGGGGLLAGCATAARGLLPGIEVVGVEPSAGDDWAQSYAKGERVRLAEVPRTIADGQQTEAPGKLTWATVRPLVSRIALVTDDETRNAMRFLFEKVKIVAEPSGATALAALLAGHIDGRGKRIGITVSGGNVGVEQFCRIMG
jgi:threo-3-hydroxy-L-aspartate ammonia-lyase